MAKYYKRFKKALIMDLNNMKSFNSLEIQYFLGHLEGCYRYIDLSEKEKDELKRIILNHHRNYNWLGNLRKNISHKSSKEKK